MLKILGKRINNTGIFIKFQRDFNVFEQQLKNLSMIIGAISFANIFQYDCSVEKNISVILSIIHTVVS